MTYIPGHHAWVGYALETTGITESTDGTTAATLPAAPSMVGYIGYTDIPETTRNFNNKKGYGVGSALALYNKRGSVTPSISMPIRVTSAEFLPYLVRNASFTPEGLQKLTLFIGVDSNVDVFRYCQCATLALAAQGGDDQEVVATATFEAIAYQLVTGATPPTHNDLANLGNPLQWHDVRQFNVEQADLSTIVDYRKTLMGLNVTLTHNLERKGTRPDWGDNNALSRTSYDIIPHLVNVSGEIALHDRLPAAYFNAAVRSQSWGDIVIPISGVSGGDVLDTAEITLASVLPTAETRRGGGPETQINYSVPFEAQDMQIAVTVPTP